ncbi:hypothetical protein O0I10_001652 [Lichtheimia ornata]|uniref:60s acidic ribosomal protein p1 n=1 Tax=Lichtheimia ornata TaxID=688661 RepID=A0AAD7VAZ5_9FUNG|nr:uncharacterized protein O0I10_001652 [Lichtheimia ornata]KAJ8662688.1 hypothetical protein O0I10_001652 [Lichtheimia ornata]
MSTAELALTYAALILQDGEVDMSAENLQTLVKKAGLTVEPIWFSIFAKALEGQDLKELLSGFSAPGAAPAGAAGAAPAGGEEKKEEAKEEEAEESDEDMGFGLFD